MTLPTKLSAKAWGEVYRIVDERNYTRARSPSGQAAAKELPPEMRELFGLKLNN